MSKEASNNPNLKNMTYSFFDDYLEKECWTQREAIILSLGCNPKTIELDTDNAIEEIKLTKGEFYLEYKSRLILLNMAIKNDDYTEIITIEVDYLKPLAVCPLSFIKWAKSNKLSLPDELKNIKIDKKTLTYFSQMPYWTVEESLALAHELSPYDVSEKILLSQYKPAIIPTIVRDIEYKILPAQSNKIKPQDFISYWQSKGNSFPIELEKLVIEHHKDDIKEIDWKGQCEKKDEEIKELNEEISTLKITIDELENDKPNTKSLNNYIQLAMGTLALLYGDEQVEIWREWAKSTLPDKVKGDLKFTEIQRRLASLNAQGIKIKRDAISKKINKSIDLLVPKESKTN